MENLKESFSYKITPLRKKILENIIFLVAFINPVVGVLRNYLLGQEYIALGAFIAEILFLLAGYFIKKENYKFSRSFLTLGILVFLLGVFVQDVPYDYMWFAVFPAVAFIIYPYQVAAFYSFLVVFFVMVFEAFLRWEFLWQRVFYMQEFFIFYTFMTFGAYYYFKILNEHEGKLEFLAERDLLTGLYNRRKFFEEIEKEIVKVERYGMSLSVVMFDIDFFKKVNDTYGHDVGDEVLKKLAEIISKNIRKSDLLVRWGGEEFIVLTPGIDVESAYNFAEKLRKIVEREKFPKVKKITISLGVTEYKPGEPIDVLLKRVDDALYLAKQKGRNRVEVVI